MSEPRRSGDQGSAQIRSAPAAPKTQTNLPVHLTSLVGRERDIAKVQSLIAAKRLVTLTGPGGIGKTRLAIEAARAALPDYPDGVWFVDLAALGSPEHVAWKLASVLGQREEAGRRLVNSLSARLQFSRALLVIDNCEHVLDASAGLVAELIQGCERLHLVCTSRERLGVPGEAVWSVPALAVPDPAGFRTPESIMEFPAVRLFFDRAYQGDSEAILLKHATTVASICRRLDGLPLAIELAAARIRILGPEQIAARLDDRFALLVGGSRLGSARQQTLRATVEWSYGLLSAAEQALLQSLSVFAGGFTVESAEQVGAGGDELSLLSGLIDKCLLVADEDSGLVRYTMLQTIREFAADRLSSSGDADRIRLGHAEHFCALAEEAEPALHGAAQAPWLDRLEHEHENLREALAWCLRAGRADIGLRMAGALWRFWYIRGYFTEGRHWLEALIDQGPPAAGAARAKALRSAAVMARVQGDFEQALAMQEEALAIFRELGDKRGIAMTLNSLGILACGTGSFEKARTILGGECLALQRELGDRRGIATCVNNLAFVARGEADYATMRSLSAESLELYRAIGFQEGMAASLLSLGIAARLLDDDSDANSYAIESLHIYRELGYREGVAEALELLAEVAAGQRRDQRAARLFGASEALRELVAAPLLPHEQRDRDQVVDALRSHMPAESFRTQWDLGRAMSIDDSVAYALDDGSTRVRRSDLPGGLTPRQVEIVGLVAQGLTDREIADRLHISPRTASTHVEHIRDKLGLRNRTELGAWAARVGLIK